MLQPVTLKLLGSPTFVPEDKPLPAEHALLLLTYLNAHDAWIERKEVLALLFANDDETVARNKLRQLLFRAKKHAWFAGFDAQPQHLKHDANTDLRAFRAAVATGNWKDAVSAYNGTLLQDTPVTNLPAYEQWLENERLDINDSYSDAAYWHAKELECASRFEDAAGVLAGLLTQDALNEEAMQAYLQVAVHTGVKAQALGHYDGFKAQLQADLGMSPLDETVALANTLIDALNQERLHALTDETSTTGTPPVSAVLVNAPSGLSAFVGRDPELSHLISLLEQPDTRLVSILGIGGIGKTRLALEVAKSTAPNLRDGAVFVPLASVTHTEHVPAAVLKAFALESERTTLPLAQLLGFLADKELLLLLDNAEHLPDIPAFVQDVLAHAPGVRLLVTSRERLNISQEQVFGLAGLALPAALNDNDVLEAYDGIRLFLRSAKRSDAQFKLRDDNKQAVLTLCQTLEGVPLALELAASWLRLMSVAEILSEAQQSFDLIESDFTDLPARHQSLRAVFDSSWRLLSSDEQTALVTLSVFAGGFTLEAARTVSGANPRVLLRLVNKSLIRRDETGRFEFLEVVRQYAFEKLLTNAPLMHTSHSKHATYYAQLTATARPHLQGSAQQRHYLNVLDTEQHNLRAALEWLVSQGELGHALTLMVDGFLFWFTRGYWQDARSILKLLVAHPASKAHASAYVLALNAYAHLLSHQGELENAARLLYEGFVLAQVDPDALAALHVTAGANQLRLGVFDDAKQHYQTALSLCEDTNALHSMADALNGLGTVAYFQADYPTAQQVYARVLALRRSLEDARGEASALNNLAGVSELQGNFKQARAYLQDSLALLQQLGDKRSLALTNMNLGFVSAELQQYDASARFFADSHQLYEQLGDALSQAETLNNLGASLRWQHKHTQALSSYQQALSIATTRHDSIKQATAHKGVAAIHNAQHNPITALHHLQQSLQLAPATLHELRIAILTEITHTLSHTTRTQLATRVLGVAQRLQGSTGVSLPPFDQAQQVQVEAFLRDVLGEAFLRWHSPDAADDVSGLIQELLDLELSEQDVQVEVFKTHARLLFE